MQDVIRDTMKNLGDVDVDGLAKGLGKSADGMGDVAQQVAKRARKMTGRDDSLPLVPMVVGVLVIVALAVLVGRTSLLDALFGGRDEMRSGDPWVD